MSNFEVLVVKVNATEPIEGADAIELARIADYRSVVKKGQFKEGSLAVYVPEGAVVPDYLLERIGLTGKLAGSAKNRVKAIKLRGTLSQGITLHVGLHKLDPAKGTIQDKDANYHEVVAGQNVAEILGIIKYEPILPTCLGGEVCNIGSENTINYDIENLKKYPDVIKEGTQVAVTEKLHGTFTMLAYVPGLNNDELIDGNKFAASKGLGAKGLVFKNNEKNVNNTYLKSFNSLTKDGIDIFTQYEKVFGPIAVPIYLLGETYGKGVQDLTYGLTEAHFRLFDVYIGRPTQGRYLNVDEKIQVAYSLCIEMVPFLYVGPFDREKINELAKGPTTLGNGAHIREGIVIVPAVEERNDAIGRTMLKHINDDYLTRSDKDATEFQ